MVRPERFELPTFCLASVRVRHGESGCAGKAAYGVQAGGLRHALAETKVAAGSGGISQAGNQHRIAGSDRGRHERYRVCEEDGGGQGEGAAGLHDRIALCAAHAAVRGTETTERRGNGPPRRLLLPSTDSKDKNKKRKTAVARPPHSDCFQDHVVLETLPVSGSSDDWKMLQKPGNSANSFIKIHRTLR